MTSSGGVNYTLFLRRVRTPRGRWRPVVVSNLQANRVLGTKCYRNVSFAMAMVCMFPQISRKGLLAERISDTNPWVGLVASKPALAQKAETKSMKRNDNTPVVRMRQRHAVLYPSLVKPVISTTRIFFVSP